MIRIPHMATVVRSDYTLTTSAHIDAPIIGVKRYSGGEQHGSVYRLLKGATEEEKQRAEDRAMLDTLYATRRFYA